MFLTNNIDSAYNLILYSYNNYKNKQLLKLSNLKIYGWSSSNNYKQGYGSTKPYGNIKICIKLIPDIYGKLVIIEDEDEDED